LICRDAGLAVCDAMVTYYAGPFLRNVSSGQNQSIGFTYVVLALRGRWASLPGVAIAELAVYAYLALRCERSWALLDTCVNSMSITPTYLVSRNVRLMRRGTQAIGQGDKPGVVVSV
jgi:hypothetical protein